MNKRQIRKQMKRQEMVFVLSRGGAMMLPCSGEKAVQTMNKGKAKILRQFRCCIKMT